MHSSMVTCSLFKYLGSSPILFNFQLVEKKATSCFLMSTDGQFSIGMYQIWPFSCLISLCIIALQRHKNQLQYLLACIPHFYPPNVQDFLKILNAHKHDLHVLPTTCLLINEFVFLLSIQIIKV
jgi:hypothetical protein